jgi:hypothetical protein
MPTSVLGALQPRAARRRRTRRGKSPCARTRACGTGAPSTRRAWRCFPTCSDTACTSSSGVPAPGSDYRPAAPGLSLLRNTTPDDRRLSANGASRRPGRRANAGARAGCRRAGRRSSGSRDSEARPHCRASRSNPYRKRDRSARRQRQQPCASPSASASRRDRGRRATPSDEGGSGIGRHRGLSRRSRPHRRARPSGVGGRSHVALPAPAPSDRGARARRRTSRARAW